MTRMDAAQLLTQTPINPILMIGEAIPLAPECYSRVTLLEHCAWEMALYYRSEHDGDWPMDRQAYLDWMLTYEPPRNLFHAELRRRAQHGEY